MNTDTPETDAAAGSLTGINLCAAFETKCRQLERQRNELRQMVCELREALRVVYNLPDSCPCGITNEAMAAWHDVGIVLGNSQKLLP